MEQVQIKKINELHNKIYCEPWLAQELDDFFTFKTPNYKFDPRYKAGIWDGNIHLFSTKTRLLYGGLKFYVEKFCEERGYEIEYLSNFGQKEFSLVEANDFIDTLGIPERFEKRDYQIQTFAHAVRNSRALLLSPTSSGKSFLIYLLLRYYQTTTLIVVPTISLVLQLFSDFKSYGFDAEKYCQCSTDGDIENVSKPIVITTWQSIFKLPKKWFTNFNLAIGDEAHQFKAKSLITVMSNLDKCQYRFGFTGTLDGTHVNKLVLEGLFGPVKQVTTTSELIEQNYLSQFKIKCIVLQYGEEERKLLFQSKYQDEIDYIVQNKRRNNFIKNLALSLNGNTLLLFQYVEKHGDILYNLIQAKVGKDRNVYFVHGGVEGEEREDIRNLVEQESNSIIIASYGTFSTGVNIRNLHNIIFASPSKSRIRNLQSIGRGLRLGDNKESCTLFDIADDLQYNRRKNHTLNHFVERIRIYNEEKFKLKIYTVDLQ